MEFKTNLPNDQRFFSLGYTCQILQVLPPQLFVLMEDLGLDFVSMIDGVPYLNAGQVADLSARLLEVRNEIESAANAAKVN